MTDQALQLFHPAIQRWFGETFSEPTRPQRDGWPRIAAGENTLILAPTGSGKTLSAFLYAIDSALRVAESADPLGGVHTLYLSPLKALANDIERNLEAPLRGIRASAEALGTTLPEIRVGVRTGDTPSNERQKMIRKPPHVLITTPESLNLLLTSVRAREMLRTVRYVIVDEIHALCPDKRGTFLTLLLERLEALVSQSPVRIGLSATQKPLGLVARFLGGQDSDGRSRPVSIVDAGMRKSMDLSIRLPVDDLTILPQEGDQGPTIWPAIYDRLIEWVDEHESTLIFANSRRVVERIASEMNRRIGYERIQAHHGSVSKEKRHEIEQALKAGQLPALVATSSMELGIDVGAIDLVCQVESPFSVASGLQRIGRAGHAVRETSKGRMIPKTRADLLMMAAVARSMRRGDISSVAVPTNPLDVLAQQVVAMVAVDEWQVDELYQCIRHAYPYRDLPLESFLSVLEMISGSYRSPDLPVLRPKVSWDRATHRLYAMPGARHTAILNGGVIPDTGQYPMVLEDGKTRLGELDEEFVFERRLGDTFVLGTGQWKILEITNDRVIVSAIDETEAMMPFWKGEGLGHDWEFGQQYGEFVRVCEERLSDPSLSGWLCHECALDTAGAENLIAFLKTQRSAGGALPTDRTVFVDAFRNEAGDERMAILSTYGRGFHLCLLLLLQGELRARGHEALDAVYSNTGLLLRLGRISPQEMMAALYGLRAESVRTAILNELENSPYFALRFRRNAGRALLLPRAKPGRRTPLWLQRLRSHELLAFASEHPGFPIVTETYRELLEDVLPIHGLESFFEAVEHGDARFVLRRDRRPTPLSSGMLLDFTGKYLYEEDRPVAARTSSPSTQADLSLLLGDRISAKSALDADAVRSIEGRLQGTHDGHRARNGAELVELLRRIGDLTNDELMARCEPSVSDILPQLRDDGRIAAIPIGDAAERWVVSDDVERYTRWSDEDISDIVQRFVSHHAVVLPQTLRDRYSIDASELDDLASAQGWIQIELSDGRLGWAHPRNAASIRRLAMSRRRRAVKPVSAERYTEFLIHRHALASPVPADELEEVLNQLSGCCLSIPVWKDVLSSRVHGYGSERLDALASEGMLQWAGSGEGGRRTLILSTSTEPFADRRRSHRDELSDLEGRLVEALEHDGASFLHQLSGRLSEPPSVLAPALWQLIWKGWVANDSLDPAMGNAPQPAQWQSRRRRPLWGKGRWSVLPGAESIEARDLRPFLRQLLHRYGVLSREVLAHEGTDLSWRDVYPVLTRMEWAGEVERAFYISGLSGPQFASREAARILARDEGDTGVVLLNVNDPVHLYGRFFPVLQANGEAYTIRHHPKNYVVLENGHPILGVENNGERLVPLGPLSEHQRLSALALLGRLVEGRERAASIRVLSWDGSPVLGTSVEGDLLTLGFVREDPGMVLYRSYASHDKNTL